MAPRLETDVIGRHGKVGVDVLSHDLPIENGLPVEIGMQYREMVDQIDTHVAEILRNEREQELAVRKGHIALADSVELQAS